MDNQKLEINQGDSFTIEETITGVSSLVGYTAKMYIKTSDSEIVVNGTIVDLKITYEGHNDQTKIYPVGTHEFETKVFDGSDHVGTPSSGKFTVHPVIKNDPS